MKVTDQFEAPAALLLGTASAVLTNKKLYGAYIATEISKTF